MADSNLPPEGEGSAPIEAQAMRHLLEVSRRINAEVVPDAILALIVDSLVSLTRADRGFLMTREPDGELRFAIARDRKGRPLEETKFQVSRGVVDEVAASGVTRLIDDAANADLWQARQSVISLSLRTILCVPMRTPDGVVGVIYVDSNAITRRFTPADVPLVEAFAAQAAAAVERVRLQRIASERDRIQRQLEIASDIQRAFLPVGFPAVEGLVGAVVSVPALEVGGDFYDVVRLPGGRADVMVGDVAGKGVPGALFGARLLSDFRYEALVHGTAGHALTSVNRIVADRATRGMFVTFFHAVIDPATGAVEYANAGHLPPMVRHADGGIDTWERPSGPPLGVLPDSQYETGHARLERGDTLLLLTDGVYDAVQAGGERFGEARILDIVRAAGGTPQAIVDAIVEETSAFRGAEPPADDLTVLAAALA